MPLAPGTSRRQIEVDLEFLRDEIVHLRGTWRAWEQLSWKENAVHNKVGLVAPTFFYYVQYSLIQSVVVNLCRMWDGARATTALHRLRKHIGSGLDPECSRQVTDAFRALDQVKPEIQRARDHHVVHLNHAIARGDESPYETDYELLEQAVDDATACIEVLWHALLDQRIRVAEFDDPMDLQELANAIKNRE